MMNLLTALFLTIGFCGFSQDQAKIDSLLQVVSSEVPDTTLLKAYKSLAVQYMQVDTALTFQYADKALEIANKTGDKGQAIKIDYLKAQSFWWFDYQSPKCKEWYLSLLSRSMAIGDEELIEYAKGRTFTYYASVLDYEKIIEYGVITEDYWLGLNSHFYLYPRLGDAYDKLNRYEEANEIYNKGIASTSNPSEKAYYLGIMGNNLGFMGAYVRALERLFESTSLYQELGDSANMAASYSRIAAVYEAEEKDIDAAIEMHLKSEVIWSTLGHSWLPYALVGLGRCYAAKNEFAKAVDYYQKGLEGYKANSDDYSVASTLDNLAELYYSIDSLDLAEEYALEAIRIMDEMNRSRGNTHIILGEIYKKKGQVRAARRTFIQGIAILEEIGMNDYLSNGLKQLSLVEAELGNDGDAYTSLLRHKELEDSIRNEEQIRAFTRMQSDFDFQQEKDSIQNANEKEQLLLNEQITRERNRQYAATAGVAVLIIVLTILYRYYRLKQRSNKELQTAYDQLRDTQSQLIQSEKMAAVGQLTAGIAHELNNPINAINASTTGIEADINDLMILLKCYENGEKYIDDPELAQEIRELKNNLDLDELRQLIPEVFEDIKNGAKRMVRIIGGLTKFSRREEIEKEPMNVHQGIEETLTLIRVALKNKVEVIKNFAENLPRIKAYPSELNQVFLNIMVNAEQAIEEHGTLTITTKQEGEKVIISFKDTGHGMDEETLNRIFEPFFTTKKVGLGTGLGMSISHRIIENHDGEIEVHSPPAGRTGEVGKGTEFIIELPVE